MHGPTNGKCVYMCSACMRICAEPDSCLYLWVRIKQFTRRYRVEGENLQPAADIQVVEIFLNTVILRDFELF